MLFWGLFDVPVTLQRCRLPRPTLSLPPQHHLSLRPAPFLHIDRSRRGFFYSAHETQAQLYTKLISRQIVSFLRRARFIFFFLLPVCIFQLFWKRGGACPGRQQCQGCQEPRPAQQWLRFFFNPCTQLLVQDKPRHQKLGLPCQHSALLFQDGM